MGFRRSFICSMTEGIQVVRPFIGLGFIQPVFTPE